nr:hypothetical protein [Ardenticatenia bacterium]
MKPTRLIIRAGMLIAILVVLSLTCVSFEKNLGSAAGADTSRWPDLVSDARAQGPTVELTVYNQNIALVRDTRSFELKPGVNQVQFSDVAAQIDPTSVLFRSLSDPEGTTVLEQNYEYDIVGSQKLMQKYVDQEIELITQDGSSYQGILLSGSDDIILQAKDGGVTVIRLDQVRQFNFPELPEGLITRPTLVWLIDAQRSGSQEVAVTYMTNGVNWHADYVVQLNEDDTALDLNGWITLDNRSGATYTDAKLKLIAGDVHVAPDEVLYERKMAEEDMAMPT